MSVVNTIRNYNSLTLNVDSDPRTGAGAQAGVNSIAIDPDGNMYKKTGTGVNDWDLIVSPSFKTSNTVYVATDGIDAPDRGSQAKPYLTVRYAMAQIADLTAWNNRYMINVAPGEYHDTNPSPLELIPNVGIQSEGWVDSVFLYFDGGMTLDPVRWPDSYGPDARSAFVNINVQAGPTSPNDDFASDLECVLDFKSINSLQGKIYFINTAIRFPLTIYGYSNENHAFFDGAFFYRDLELWDLSVLITNSNDIFAENPYKFFISSVTAPPGQFFTFLNVICIASWFKHVFVQPPYKPGEPPFDNTEFGQTGGAFVVLDLEVHELGLAGPNTYVQATAASIPSNIPSPKAADLALFQLNPSLVIDPSFSSSPNSFLERLDDGFSLGFKPFVSGNWNPQPDNIRDAVDQLGSRVKALEVFDYDQTVYVSLNGSDTTGTGGQHQPFRTISYAMSQITDAADNKRYIIQVSPGEYDEGYTSSTPFYIKPYVWIRGENVQEFYLDVFSLELDDAFGLDNQARAGLENANLFGPIYLEFANWTMPPAGPCLNGKFYLKGCWLDTFTANGFSNTNQLVFDDCIFFSNVIIAGFDSTVQNCFTVPGVTMTVTSSTQGAYNGDVYFTNSTLSNLIVTRSPGAIMDVYGYNSSVTGVLQIFGTNGSFTATTDFFPIKSNLTFGPGVSYSSLTLVNDAYGLAYTPSVVGNWSGIAPSSVADALDRVAAMIGPIP